MNKTQTAVIEWMANGETGLSSEAIAFNLAFGQTRRRDYPLDPSDFCRCIRLLNAAPGLRKKLPEMAKVSKHWRRLVARWTEIEATLVAEVGETSVRTGRWSIPAIKTDELMKTVLDGKRKAR